MDIQLMRVSFCDGVLSFVTATERNLKILELLLLFIHTAEQRYNYSNIKFEF